MDIQYIFLSEVPDKTLKGMPTAFLITYTDNSLDNPKHIQWPRGEKVQIINLLIKSARRKFWAIAVNSVLSKYAEVCDNYPELRKKILVSEPESFNIEVLPEMQERSHNLLFRDLRHEAIKICNRKTAFVFPEQWPEDDASIFKKELVKMMVSDVSAFFREAPASFEFPWFFLSLRQNTRSKENKNPLSEFISSVHSSMLKEYGSIDTRIWSQKSGTILLSGPTGSGKSYAARLLAELSKYNSKLVEVNLAAVGESLLESRMRGYKKGAFTGAAKDTPGWFEDADNGVLFLDEFQSTPPSFQVQLLDILSAVSDDVYIAKIGKDKYREKFNVKIIIAINEDIDLLLEQKRLRKDIFYRIRHIESFPSLKERLGKDKEHRYLRGLLFTYRWKSISIDIDDIKIGRTDMISSFFPVFTQEALSELANQDWDGNFRELERIAFDLFYECDSGNKSASIDDLRIKEIINSWNNKTTKLNTSEQTNTLSEAEQRKLKDIQYALRKSEFVIADFIKCQHQSYYKSRVSLRTYLKTHKDFLDTDVINDSRIIKFINHGKNTRSN